MGVGTRSYVKAMDMGFTFDFIEGEMREKSLFEEPTWFYVANPNLDPTLGVAMGVEVVYPSIWEVKVGSGPR